MLGQSEAHLVVLSLVDRPAVPARAPRRGRPVVYADQLIRIGLVVTLVRMVRHAHGLLAILSEPTPSRWPRSGRI